MPGFVVEAQRVWPMPHIRVQSAGVLVGERGQFQSLGLLAKPDEVTSISPPPWFCTCCTEPWGPRRRHLQGIRPSRGEPAGSCSAVGEQPGGEVVVALEIEQGFRQGLELLQWQGLDGDGGGLAQGATAAG